MLNWTTLWRLLGRERAATALSDTLWTATMSAYPFLAALSAAERDQLRLLAAGFLDSKQFQGAGGLDVTDDMAVAVAAQACLPLVGWARQAGVRAALRWYDDFVGVVLHPAEVVARRETVDDAGVVHQWREAVVGEAMDRGPVMLSWDAVAEAGISAGAGFNVVVHEFAHKLDLRDGAADGCPPLPRGFLGASRGADARRRWNAVMQPAYDTFRERCIMAARFGAAPPWLDSYAATSPGEFFAVACEGYFVNRPAFGADCPTLVPLFDAFFRPHTPMVDGR